MIKKASKVDIKERAEVVKAMELIVRCVNDENLLTPWLAIGVADGDITESTTVEDIINDEYYIENQNFSELMGLFLRLMAKAKKKGGLYAGGVVSSDY